MRDPLHASEDLQRLPVYDAEGVPIGTTFGVLTEAATGLVRFFDVEIEGRSRHVLVPVGHARIEKHLGRLRVRLRAASAHELERIPAYEPHIVYDQDAFHNDLLDAFGRLFEGQRYYAHPAYDHSGLYAGTHPLLRDPLAPPSAEGLRRLSATHGFQIVQGEPDVTGWTLLGSEGERLGIVTDLVIDAAVEQVRYLVVRRDADDAETVLPVGYVDVGDHVVECDLAADDLLALPEFSGAVLGREAEVQLRVELESLLRGDRTFLRADFRNAA